jgi:hypothetical protein
MVTAKKIYDCSFIFSIEHWRPGMAVGEREPVLVCDPVAVPVANGGLRDARVSRNLRDGSALQIGRMEVVEDFVDIGVSIDMILAFHDSLEGRDHREDEIVNGQYHRSRI